MQMTHWKALSLTLASSLGSGEALRFSVAVVGSVRSTTSGASSSSRFAEEVSSSSASSNGLSLETVLILACDPFSLGARPRSVVRCRLLACPSPATALDLPTIDCLLVVGGMFSEGKDGLKLSVWCNDEEAEDWDASAANEGCWWVVELLVEDVEADNELLVVHSGLPLPLRVFAGRE